MHTVRSLSLLLVGGGLPACAAVRMQQPGPELQEEARAAVFRSGGGECRKSWNNLCDPQASGVGSREVLVTGIGATGTHSLSAMFKMNGLELQHEHLGRDGSVSWPFATNIVHTGFRKHPCRYLPWLKPPGARFRHVYHVVRCPIDTISALTTHNHCAMSYISQALRFGVREPKEGDVRFWAKAWLKWNEFIDGYARQRFPLTEFQELYKAVCKDLGNSDEVCAAADLPESANHRSHGKLTWQQLSDMDAELTEEIKALATRYGFGEDCTDDAVRAEKARKSKRALGPGAIVTHGIPGAQCSNDTGVDCSDGIDWVWSAATLAKIKRNATATLQKAWAEIY